MLLTTKALAKALDRFNYEVETDPEKAKENFYKTIEAATEIKGDKI